jgi:signal-transduction protein with cAMP-binding, CBS, and nucleotidyltransferase domain
MPVKIVTWTGMLDQSITEIMGLMTKHRLRHLPVIENSRLCGIISIGDVVKKHHEEMMLENHYLKNYIQS